jgi:hypothetical protein
MLNLVGIMLEQRYESEESLFSEYITYITVSIALSFLISSRHIRDQRLWSPEGLSPWGFDYIKNTTLNDILERHTGFSMRV